MIIIKMIASIILIPYYVKIYLNFCKGLYLFYFNIQKFKYNLKNVIFYA